MSNDYLSGVNKQNFGSRIISSFNISTKTNSDTGDINMKINVNYSYPRNLTLSNSSNIAPTFAELLFTRKSNIGWVWALAMPTGWALLVVLIVMTLFALPCIRKNGYFQVSFNKDLMSVMGFLDSAH